MVSISEDWNINYITKQIYHDQWKDEITGSSTSVAEIGTALCLAKASFDENDYFVLYSAKDETSYYVWYDKGTGTDPEISGKTGIQVDISADTTDIEVAARTVTAINAANSTLDFSAANGGTATVTITNINNGSTTNIADSSGAATGFTFNTTTPGVGETVLSVNALYSWLQDTFDELGQMDDQVPMSAQTPTEYTLINEWFIDEVSIKYLNGGAIQTSDWTRVAGTGTNIGIVQAEYSAAGTAPDENDLGETVTDGTNGDTGTLLFADTTRSLLWIRPDTTDVSDTDGFDSTSGVTLTCTSGMSVTQTTVAAITGENKWANMYTIGTIESNTAIYVIQDSTKLSAWWPVGHIDILVRVQEFDSTTGDNSGSLGTIMIGARQYYKLFDHFVSTSITGGRNPVPLATGADLNNTTGQYSILLSSSSGTFAVGERFEVASSDPRKEGTITAVSGSNPTVTLSYYLSGTDRTQFATTNTIVEIGSGDGTGVVNGAPTALVADYGTTDPITMTFGDTSEDMNNGNGSVDYDVIINCGGRTVAQLYEWLKYTTTRGYTNPIDDSTAYPTQLKTGTGTTADTNIDGEQYIYLLSSFTPVKASPFGTFAGGKFFGAQGVWITNYATADAQNFQLIDSTGTSQVPPNTISVTVNSVVTDDVVGVFVYDTVGGEVDKDTYTLGGEAAGTSTIGVGAQIDNETPQSGVLRVVDFDAAAKTEYQYEYDSWSYTVFTLNTLYTSGTPGTISTAGTSTILTDDDGTNFWTAKVRAGDKVTNKTDVSTATVVTVSTDQLVTTALSGGTDDTWQDADEYYVETVTSILHTTDDNLYVPIINEVVRADYAGSTTSISNTLIKGTGNPIPVIVRVRQGKVILPFEITNTVTATAGMTQAAIRTTDSIAT